MVDTLNSKNLGRWNGRINTLNESLKTLSDRYPNANIKPMNNEKSTRLAQIFENTRLAIDSYTNRSRMLKPQIRRM
jgi:hypothetical protein